MSNELIEVEEATVLQAFTSGDGLDPIINQAKELVDGFEHDLTTEKGRKATKSLAAKVSKLKVRLDDAGKELVSSWKEQAKVVDNSRKDMRERLDALRDEARKPVTDWENAEKDRIASHEAAFFAIGSLSSSIDDEGNKYGIDELNQRMVELTSIVVDSSYEEYELKAIKEQQQSVAKLTIIIADEQKRLDNEAELVRLKQAEEDRRQQEHEENIKREAADAARLAAEAVAKEASEKAETEKQEAINRAEESKRQAEESERARIAAEENAKIEAGAAAERARLTEIKRREDEEKAEQEAKAKREANKAHISKIRKSAKEGLMKYVDEATAVKIVLAIHAGEIDNIKITY
jgi:colicin import membrane protein